MSSSAKMACFILLVCLFFSTSLSFSFGASMPVTDVKFEASDLQGAFKQVTNVSSCPRAITHKSYATLNANPQFPGGANVTVKKSYAVAHEQISQNGVVCTSHGSLTVSEVDIESAVNATSRHLGAFNAVPILASIAQQNATTFLGFEETIRTCGGTGITAGTFFFFVEEEKNVNITGIPMLTPGSKYMIVSPLTSDAPCLYASRSAKKAPAKENNNMLCFPADATVAIAGGRRKRMDEVRVGDRVRVGPDEFSDVFLFTHREKKSLVQFVQIETVTGHIVQLTDGHFVYCNGELVPARDVRVGDVVELENGEKVPVLSVGSIVKQARTTRRQCTAILWSTVSARQRIRQPYTRSQRSPFLRRFGHCFRLLLSISRSSMHFLPLFMILSPSGIYEINMNMTVPVGEPVLSIAVQTKLFRIASSIHLFFVSLLEIQSLVKCDE